jgi:hypothetical protein
MVHVMPRVSLEGVAGVERPVCSIIVLYLYSVVVHC